MSVVPTIIKYMLDRAEHEDIDFGNSESLKHLRFARSASAPLPASVQQQFESTFGVPMIENDGLDRDLRTDPVQPDASRHA